MVVNMLRDDDQKKSSESDGCRCSIFKMPLHYPRYTKQDYEAMAEWQLDRLLAEYGLPVHGDLAYKKHFAMGAFLWPEHDDDDDGQEHKLITGASGYSHNLKNFEEDDSSSGSQNKKSLLRKLVSFLYRAIGHHA